MLGDIFGRMAGEAVPLGAILARFLFLFVVESERLWWRRLPGVFPDMGEPAVGLAIAEGNMADEGVLEGPIFGVLRADWRGVPSTDGAEGAEGASLVCILVKEGLRKLWSAASGNWKSSSMPPSLLSVRPGADPFAWSLLLSPVNSDFGVAAEPGVLILPLCG